MPETRASQSELLPLSQQRNAATGYAATSSYQSFAEVTAENDHDPLVMIQVAADSTSKYSAWQNLIQDLDFFFARIYEFHQKSGLSCIVADKVLSLVQFVFVVLFSLFLLHLVDYDVMFKRKKPTHQSEKVTISDVLLPIDSVVLSNAEIFLLIFASFYWVVLFVRMVHYVVVQHAIKGFYSQALNIKDCTAYTWLEVQDRLLQAQNHVLIQETAMDELDVHNRILRQTNYLIGLMNKGLIPVHYRLPLVGEVTHLSEGFLFNLKLLLFATVGPGALFEKNWKLRSEVKSTNNRPSISMSFSLRCKVFALLNLLLMPLIFLWQVLHLFFTYAEVLKRDPSLLFGSRNWSPYARLLCRHLNELDHQLDERLNRGYKSASKYMNSFTSPFMEIIAKHVAFIASSVLAVLLLLTVYDEDVITVEHVITIMTGLGAIVAVSRAFIADIMPQKLSQSELYAQILEHVHYVPSGYAPYTLQARAFVSTLFPYRITTLLHSFLSPIVTPFILVFCMPSRAEQIVDFFRICTKEVPGTGDVCNFAMFNIKEQGNECWRPGSSSSSNPQSGDGRQAIQMRAEDNVPRKGSAAAVTIPPNLLCTEDGKLELSLIHFKLTNPKWHPAEPAQDQFLNFVAKESVRDTLLLSQGIDSGKERDNECGITSSASPSHRTQSLHPQESILHLQSIASPPMAEAGQELPEVLTRERSKVLSSLTSEQLHSHMDSNLCMTLSTLFLHEYHAAATTQRHERTSTSAHGVPTEECETGESPALPFADSRFE